MRFLPRKLRPSVSSLIDWYASTENLKLVDRLGLTFFTILKSNRIISLSKESGWIHLDDIDWTEERLQNGVMVKLNAS
jgi:hypothetical protein